jgi:hypothetical protein
VPFVADPSEGVEGPAGPAAPASLGDMDLPFHEPMANPPFDEPAPVPAPEPTVVAPSASAPTHRPRRLLRPSQRVRDQLPELPELTAVQMDALVRSHIDTLLAAERAPTPPLIRTPSPETHVPPPRPKPDGVVTPMSKFGVRRVYPDRPTYTPPTQPELKLRFHGTGQGLVCGPGSVGSIVQPYANFSSWLMDYHFYMHGDSVSETRHNALIDCLVHPLYRQPDVDKKALLQARNRLKDGFRPSWLSAPVWKEKTITIYIPPQGALSAAERKKYVSLQNRYHRLYYKADLIEPDESPLHLGIPFRVPGFYYKPFAQVVKDALTVHPAARHIHLMPFEELVLKDTSTLFNDDAGERMPIPVDPTPHPSHLESTDTNADVPPPFVREDYERVHGEAYASSRYHDIYEELQELKWRIQHHPEFEGHPNRLCPLEWVALGSIEYSDATIPFTFSNLKLWPVYRFLACLTKYFRGQASANAAEEIAFFPGVCI